MLICTITQCMGEYKLTPYEDFETNKLGGIREKTLFIMDFSQSMSEYLNNERKVDLMLETMSKILPTLNKNSHIGLRVYGHRIGFTPFDACRASKLVVPISPASSLNIHNRLQTTQPRGMTPITFSLKQAINNDFSGYYGKKHIILLTDGGENCDESPCDFAMELVKTRKDVKIDVIAFNINDAQDLAQLECTALVTKGIFYTANTVGELLDSLNNSLNIQKDVDAKIIGNY